MGIPAMLRPVTYPPQPPLAEIEAHKRAVRGLYRHVKSFGVPLEVLLSAAPLAPSMADIVDTVSNHLNAGERQTCHAF